MSKKIKIADLSRRIIEARAAYYNKQSMISDDAFDALYDELKKLDPKNKAVTSIGAPVEPSEWKKAKHQIPMGSLDKVQNVAEMTDWISSVSKEEDIFISCKLDGFSIELIYDEGKLMQAVTRGNGEIGEDITVNVRRIHGTPLTVPDNFTGSLRGEIVLRRSNHKLHFADYANPRNAVGICKRLDGVGVEHLDLFLYQALGSVEFTTEEKQFIWLENAGAQVPKWEIVTGSDSKDIAAVVNDVWARYQIGDREGLDYDIDGLVVRINDLDKQSALGDKDMRPRGAVAMKFPAMSLPSILRDITWNCGNTNRISPVGVFDSVILGGAEITQASLYNYSYIKKLGLDINAKVMISRANDVIPKISECLESTGTVANYPDKCPTCSQITSFEGEYLICKNDDCSAQTLGRINTWINTLDIKEWGEALLERLVKSGKVQTIADLYRLTAADLAGIERMGDKSAQKCYDILHAGSEITVEVLLGALNIPLIGSSMIRMVTSAGHDTLEKIQALSKKDLENISGLGPAKADSLYDGLRKNKALIAELLTVGVTIKQKIVGGLSGAKIAITGSTSMKRADLQKFIEDNGGENKSSVGKGCTHLVIADVNSTSSKAIAARKIGIKLISEKDLLSMAI